MVEWDTTPERERRYYGPLLRDVREKQHERPLAWAVIARFENHSSGRAAVGQLASRGRHPGFQFRSKLDRSDNTVTVQARWVGE